MPTYEYKCERCEYSFEVSHSMSDEPIVNCPQCNAIARKIITGGSGFFLKGSSTSSMKDNLTTKCGKEQTCCGSATPCKIRPCEK